MIPARDQRVAHRCRRQPEIGHAVAGDVDDPAAGRLGHVVEGRRGREQRRPIAVSPCELRWVARTAAAKAAALALVGDARPADRDHDACRDPTIPAPAPRCRPVPPPIASTSCGFSKARAMPSCCSSYSSASTLSDTSTASTSARSTVAARAEAAAGRAEREQARRRVERASSKLPGGSSKRHRDRREPLLRLLRRLALPAQPDGVRIR